ncbi:unnamed protein product, partial [marine sediment metagenome]
LKGIRAAEAREVRAVRAAKWDYSLSDHYPRTIYVPYMDDHGYMMAAAVRAGGAKAEQLPMQDEEAIALARKYTTGKECYPCVVTIAGLLQKVTSDDFFQNVKDVSVHNLNGETGLCANLLQTDANQPAVRLVGDDDLETKFREERLPQRQEFPEVRNSRNADRLAVGRVRLVFGIRPFEHSLPLDEKLGQMRPEALLFHLIILTAAAAVGEPLLALYLHNANFAAVRAVLTLETRNLVFALAKVKAFKPTRGLA